MLNLLSGSEIFRLKSTLFTLAVLHVFICSTLLKQTRLYDSCVLSFEEICSSYFSNIAYFLLEYNFLTILYNTARDWQKSATVIAFGNYPLLRKILSSRYLGNGSS